jgi:pimeloyl-ACP methyl ester carboxylesterase
MKRWLRNIALCLAGLVAVALLVGAGYEMNGRRRAARDYPPPGRMVDIGGRRIQLDCRGSGSPTVVFESGLGMDGSLGWTAVHDSIARTTRACTYSRAGILWSDPSDGPRLGNNVATDLHATLRAAGESAPLVLVGHSVGGPYVVTYTQRFGGDVAGIVLVDGSHPDQAARLREVTSMTVQKALGPFRIASSLRWTGVVRALSHSAPAEHHDLAYATRVKAAFAPTSLAALLQEAEGLDSTFAEAGASHQLGHRPLFVLTAGAPASAKDLAAMRMTPAQGKRRSEIWNAMQDEEAAWSTRSQHTVVADATHYIQFDRPDVVIAAIRAVVDSVRASRP